MEKPHSLKFRLFPFDLYSDQENPLIEDRLNGGPHRHVGQTPFLREKFKINAPLVLRKTADFWNWFHGDYAVSEPIVELEHPYSLIFKIEGELSAEFENDDGDESNNAIEYSLDGKGHHEWFPIAQLFKDKNIEVIIQIEIIRT